MHTASTAFWMMPSALYNIVLLWTVGVSELLLDAKLFAPFSKLNIIEPPVAVKSYNQGYSIGARVSQNFPTSVL